MRTYLDICEEYAAWLSEKPRERIVRICSDSGNYGTLFASPVYKDIYGKDGIAMQMEANELTLVVYPLHPRWKVVETYESYRDYMTAKFRSNHEFKDN